MALRRMRRRALILATVVALMAPAAPAHASVLGGVADLLHGVLALPLGILSGTFSGPPVIGTVHGILAGSVNTISYTARGLLQLAGTAIPAAATLAPYLPLVL